MIELTDEMRCWIRDQVDTVSTTPISEQDLKNGYDASVLLAVVCFEYAANVVAKRYPHPFAEQPFYCEQMYEILNLAQDMWEYLCEYIEETYPDTDCQKVGLLAAVIILTKDDTSETILGKLVREAVPKILQERGMSLFKDPIPGYPAMDSAEVDRIIASCDRNLVEEFFRLFKEIKVFHGDVSKYTNPEDIDRHKRMVAIFTKMVESSEK